MLRRSQFSNCALKMTVVDDVSSVSVWAFVGQCTACDNIMQVRDLTVNVSRHELRPYWVLTNLDAQQYNKWRNSFEKRG